MDIVNVIGRPVACKLSWIAWCLLMIGWSAPAAAAPSLSVTDIGVNVGGNTEWSVTVSPDPNLFFDAGEGQGLGGSLDVELAFEITGSDLLSASVDPNDWPNNNPGNNPFTGTVTLGVDIDLAADTLFAALGSEFFTSAAAVEVLVIETMGSGLTAVSWGGHTFLPGTLNEYIGSRIAQAGINFDGFQGSVGDFVGTFEEGDFDEDGDVDSADEALWEIGYGIASGAVHGDGDADSDFDVDGNDFLIWQRQFGFPFSPVIGSASTSPIPEPTGFTLLSLALGLVAASRGTR
ncbi:MAG: hypothetical protein IH831_03745 [Planctomycetes bacterium]|nr:hypothetical protein [Planctomycetota bacterium]